MDSFTCALVLAAQEAMFRTLLRDWKPRLPVALYRGTFLFLCSLWPILIYACTLLLGRKDRTYLMPAWVRSSAVGFLLFWGACSIASLAIYWIYKRMLQAVAKRGVSEGRRSLLRTAGVAAVASPFAVLGFGAIVTRTAYRVEEVDVRIAGLHPDLEGMRIAQISDLHVSPFLSVKELGRVVDMTNELKPYLTVVTGDLISSAGDPVAETIRELGRLRADHGILGCLGNHEVYARTEAFTVTEAAKYGVNFLRHRGAEIRRGNGIVNVAGVDFQPFAMRGHYLERAEELVRTGMPNILLSHNPDVFPIAAKKGFDLTLAGHTHAGQVTVEILHRNANMARFFTPYVAGLYESGGKSCYVNAGIGTIGMPVRIGAPPEITLIRLRKA